MCLYKPKRPKPIRSDIILVRVNTGVVTIRQEKAENKRGVEPLIRWRFQHGLHFSPPWVREGLTSCIGFVCLDARKTRYGATTSVGCTSSISHCPSFLEELLEATLEPMISFHYHGKLMMLEYGFV